MTGKIVRLRKEWNIWMHRIGGVVVNNNKFRFERKVGPYFLLYSIYTGILTVIALLTYAICMRITGELWLVLVWRAAVCMILPNILLTICYCRTQNFRLLLKTGMELLDGIRK